MRISQGHKPIHHQTVDPQQPMLTYISPKEQNDLLLYRAASCKKELNQAHTKNVASSTVSNNCHRENRHCFAN